jgi:hypothetical protein
MREKGRTGCTTSASGGLTGERRKQIRLRHAGREAPGATGHVHAQEVVHRFESYDGKTWSGQYRGGKTIIIRVGRKVRFPNTWDRIIELPNWEDLFVGLLCWCVCLHYQKACWARKNPGQQTKYRRTDCQEITTRMIRRWRVDDSYNLILEKADAD